MSAATFAPGEYSNLEVALRYAFHGIAVFPCKPEKSPYTPNGFKDAVTDEFTIRRWWKQYPEAIPAIACAVSCLVVIDCDIKDDFNGVEEFKQIAADCGIDPAASPSVRTQSGGAHCYFKLPADMEPTDSRGQLAERYRRSFQGLRDCRGCSATRWEALYRHEWNAGSGDLVCCRDHP